jgi:3-phosphoshikimate 1-carboxyvinyltransferase
VAKGSITAPPSKSYTHRAMVLGALTHSHFSLVNPLMSEDTRATLDALYALGTEFRNNSRGVLIHCDKFRRAPGVIDAKNSGTTIRLMAGIASLIPEETTLTGDESLARRPMGPLVEALSQLGARCQYLGNPGKPPLKIRGPVTGSRAEIPGDISSQFVSSLLIACSQKNGDTEIILKGQLRSRPYVDITLQMLREFGADVEEKDQLFFVKGTQRLTRETYTVPGDYSSASFPLVAAAITGGEVTVRGLDLNSPQGDKAILQHLRSFGATVSLGKDSAKVSGGELEGTEIDVRHTPDLFPVLAVLGSVASGRTVLKGGENLRAKESDRIATTTTFLRDMGARIVPRDDGCEVVGGDKLHGTTVQTEGDHRILMAAAIAGLVSSSETRIDDNDSFNVSYPGFLRDMLQLGCRMEVRK